MVGNSPPVAILRIFEFSESHVSIMAKNSPGENTVIEALDFNKYTVSCKSQKELISGNDALILSRAAKRNIFTVVRQSERKIKWRINSTGHFNYDYIDLKILECLLSHKAYVRPIAYFHGRNMVRSEAERAFLFFQKRF